MKTDESERSREYDLLTKHYVIKQGKKVTRNLISVIYFDNTPGMVKPEELDELIQKRMIISFRRSNEWVRIKGDQIREEDGKYEGPERREG
jgi:hypothetical protein